MPVTARLAGLLVAAACACAGDAARRGAPPDRWDRAQIAAGLADERAFLIGHFALDPHGVIDGDTIRVGGLPETLRLVGLDAEETFKHEGDRRLFERGWDLYLAEKQAAASRPVKVPTPMGEEAAAWARDFFRGVRTLRLERDHPKELRDRFGRQLAYVFAERDGAWINYNVEAVRAGMSPYFTKYGHSRRFHRELAAAQAEARAAGRGIWDPSKQHYPDYDTRLRWWEARAEFVAEFEREAEAHPEYIPLGHWDALRRLAAREGRDVVVLATVGPVYRGDRVSRVLLERRIGESLPLVFFDPKVLERSGIERWVGEYVRVAGIVSRSPTSRRPGLQIVVDVASQVRLPAYVPPGPGPPAGPEDPAPAEFPPPPEPEAPPAESAP